jgi:hypothetical protein
MTTMSEEQWDEYIEELADLYAPPCDPDPQEF